MKAVAFNSESTKLWLSATKSITRFTTTSISAFQIHKRIQKMSKKKATVYGDIPMKIIKEFSVDLSELMCWTAL